MKLATLQQQFAKALHYQALGEECDIVSDAFSADERMQIYRNNFIVSLSEVLLATYPMVTSLLGEECFLQIARQHVLSTPLTQGDVSAYGEQFDATLKQFDTVMQAAPYIAAVAQFEWALDCSQQRFSRLHATEYSLADLSQLSASQHADIQFQLHPDVVLFDSPFAIYALQKIIHNHSKDFSQLDIQQAQQGICACNDNGEIWSQALSEQSYQLLLHLKQNLTLGDIAPEYLSALNQIIELNIIAGFSLSPQLTSELDKGEIHDNK
ncbi:hypothetical protein VII00023_07669 [Vibrio ichthyoenteri ATCC 700023]|uniref:Putative DNA-binding domain-containing protein n=1 Tax=Vibrio ichthyoenteri ATCC 700023 TaxID=870968 RepID=F9S4F3_9VIBR|nr:DNA-binding domain-containing protein [Vibrio ichthyoenteri]EGU36822.1 hypothetical protein VII00023_07669 [Vibrio ichthyoenteri ATCC 700023]